MKGALFALATVLTWALMGVVNRYCVSRYGINVLVFTSFLIFSGGVALLLIRERVNPENWKSGVDGVSVNDGYTADSYTHMKLPSNMRV